MAGYRALLIGREVRTPYPSPTQSIPTLNHLTYTEGETQPTIARTISILAIWRS